MDTPQRDEAGRDGESWSGQGDALCPAGCFLALLAVLAAGTDTPATADLEVSEPDIAPAPEVAVRLLTESGDHQRLPRRADGRADAGPFTVAADDDLSVLADELHRLKRPGPR